jgi:hypothetical protein
VLAFLWLRDARGDHPVLRCLPPIESEELRTIFDDPWTLWFDDETFPQLMLKDTNSGRATVHHAKTVFNRIDRSSNPNREFPWANGGGMSQVDKREIDLIKFYWQPDHLPVLCFESQRVRYNYRKIGNQPWEAIPREVQGFDGIFPLDSVVGEIISLYRNNRTRPFEVRTLVKEGDGHWQPYVYRQFETDNDLATLVFDLGYVQLANTIGNLPIQEHHVVDDSHPYPVVSFEFQEVVLPRLPDDVVEAVLSSPLKVVSYPLRITAEHTQIIPRGWRASAIGINREDCSKCHQHAFGQHVSKFETVNDRRDWYGFVRGTDGIFSFPYLDHSSAVGVGGYAPPRFNAKLIASGHVKVRR